MTNLDIKKYTNHSKFKYTNCIKIWVQWQLLPNLTFGICLGNNSFVWKLANKEGKRSIFSTSPIEMILQCNQITNKGTLHKRIPVNKYKWQKNHYSNKIMDQSNNHKWLIKLLGGKLGKYFCILLTKPKLINFSITRSVTTIYVTPGMMQ